MRHFIRKFINYVFIYRNIKNDQMECAPNLNMRIMNDVRCFMFHFTPTSHFDGMTFKLDIPRVHSKCELTSRIDIPKSMNVVDLTRNSHILIMSLNESPRAPYSTVIRL